MIPPLSQSLVQTLACPEGYVEQFVKGRKMPDSEPSFRGTTIHNVMGAYIRHCKQVKKSSDWVAFDKLASTAGIEAYQILEGMRDNYLVDFSRAGEPEVRLGLDEDFQPCDPDSPECAYAGTPDIVYALDDAYARIEDFKSHFKIFEADTFQSRLYILMLLQHHPDLAGAYFELVFVRYARARRRSELYTRLRIPELMAEAERYRAIQLEIYDDANVDTAIPHAGCQYCPKLADMSCSMADTNVHLTMDPSRAAKVNVWARQLVTISNTVIRAASDAKDGAPVTFDTATGKTYSFGSVAGFQRTLSIRKAWDLLQDQIHATPSDDNLLDKVGVKVSSLAQYAKAKKRVVLDGAFQDALELRPKTTFKLTTSDTGTDNTALEGEEYED